MRKRPACVAGQASLPPTGPCAQEGKLPGVTHERISPLYSSRWRFLSQSIINYPSTTFELDCYLYSTSSYGSSKYVPVHLKFFSEGRLHGPTSFWQSLFSPVKNLPLYFAPEPLRQVSKDWPGLRLATSWVQLRLFVTVKFLFKLYLIISTQG